MVATNLVQISNTVISANAVQETHASNDSIGSRQLIGLSVTADKLGANANLIVINANITAANSFAASNDYTTYLIALSNDYTTFLDAHANDYATHLDAHANDYATYIQGTANVDIVQDNLTALISGVTQFTAEKTFQDDIIILGNLTVEGTYFTANVANVTTEDKTIIVNWEGTDATAEDAGLQIAGTGNALLANIYYNTAATNKFRIGTGTLTAADDIATLGDTQANDYNLFTQVLLNAGDTMEGDLTMAAATQIILDTASATDPSITFTNQQDAGLFDGGSNSIGFAVEGVETASLYNGDLWLLATGDASKMRLIRDEQIEAGVGEYQFFGREQTSGDLIQIASLIGTLTDNTNTLYDGTIGFKTAVAGTAASRMVVANGAYMTGATGTDQGSGTLNATNLYVHGNEVWHAGNDGPTSGLDADTLDGLHAADLGGTNLLPYANTNTALGTSNVFFLGTPNTASAILAFIDGVEVGSSYYTYHSSNHTIEFDEIIPNGATIDTQAWSQVT